MSTDGHILAFDFGTHFIGVALGHSLIRQARPLTTVTRKNKTYDWAQIENLINEWQPTALVVGLPLTRDGGEQPMSQLSAKFANQLRGRFELPVYETDERLTSKEAAAIIRAQGGRANKARVDQTAAAVILQAFFETQGTDDSD